MYGGPDRWFAPYLYNMTRVVEKMAILVESRGGEVERHSEELAIHTRGFADPIDRKKHNIAVLRKHIAAQAQIVDADQLKEMAENLGRIEQELADLQRQEDVAPIIKTRNVSLVCDLWINFTLDGYLYHFGVDYNMFFPDSVSKIPIEDVSSERNYYLDKVECENKVWVKDCLLDPVAKEDDVEKCAKVLLSFLTHFPVSELCDSQ